MRKSDLPFVTDSWVLGYRMVAGEFRGLDKQYYFDSQRKVIDALCAKATVLIAASSEDSDQIFGCAIFTDTSPRQWHWVYVKKAFRGFGIGSKLTSGVKPGDHYCQQVNDRRLVKRLGLIFNPYPLYGLAL